MNALDFAGELLQGAVNQVVRLDPQTVARLGEIEGKVICLRILDTEGNPLWPDLFILPAGDGLHLRSEYEGRADVTLSGTISLFARLALKDKLKWRFSPGELSIGGDIELGQHCQRIMETIDIDWEERLSRFVGDVLAHQFGNIARAAGAWQERSLRTVGRDISEYLIEESRMLSSRARVEAFLRAVDGMRADVDRLEQRYKRLRERA